MAKVAKVAASSESTIPLPIVALAVVVAFALAAGGLSGSGGHGPRRHGHFEVTIEWNDLTGGVLYQVKRNGVFMTPKDPMRVPAAGTSIPRVSRFAGWSDDKVHVNAKPLQPSAKPTPNGALFVSIIFQDDSGTVAPPVHQRDTAPVDRGGIKLNW